MRICMNVHISGCKCWFVVLCVVPRWPFLFCAVLCCAVLCCAVLGCVVACCVASGSVV